MTTETTLSPEITALVEKYKLHPLYGTNWKEGDVAARRVIKGVETKDYVLLARLKYSDAKFEREVFNLMTGLKLPKTQRDSETMLKEFSDPKSIQTEEWHRIRRCGEAVLDSLRWNTTEHNDQIMNQKEFLDTIIQQGFRQIEVVRNKTNRNETRLNNSNGTFYVLNQYGFKDYVTYAIAMLEKAEETGG